MQRGLPPPTPDEVRAARSEARDELFAMRAEDRLARASGLRLAFLQIGAIGTVAAIVALGLSLTTVDLRGYSRVHVSPHIVPGNAIALRASYVDGERRELAPTFTLRARLMAATDGDALFEAVLGAASPFEPVSFVIPKTMRFTQASHLAVTLEHGVDSDNIVIPLATTPGSETSCLTMRPPITVSAAEIDDYHARLATGETEPAFGLIEKPFPELRERTAPAWHLYPEGAVMRRGAPQRIFAALDDDARSATPTLQVFGPSTWSYDTPYAPPDIVIQLPRALREGAQVSRRGEQLPRALRQSEEVLPEDTVLIPAPGSELTVPMRFAINLTSVFVPRDKPLTVTVSDAVATGLVHLDVFDRHGWRYAAVSRRAGAMRSFELPAFALSPGLNCIRVSTTPAQPTTSAPERCLFVLHERDGTTATDATSGATGTATGDATVGDAAEHLAALKRVLGAFGADDPLLRAGPSDGVADVNPEHVAEALLTRVVARGCTLGVVSETRESRRDTLAATVGVWRTVIFALVLCIAIGSIAYTLSEMLRAQRAMRRLAAHASALDDAPDAMPLAAGAMTYRHAWTTMALTLLVMLALWGGVLFLLRAIWWGAPV